LQFFPNQAQFANDLVGDLVFHDFTSLSRNTIAFTAGNSIVHVEQAIMSLCGAMILTSRQIGKIVAGPAPK